MIWAKSLVNLETQTACGNAMPEPTLDRPSRNYEFLFLFSKRPDYRFDRRAIDIPARSSARRGDRANAGSVWQTQSWIISDSDAMPDGIWQINPEASPYRHVAMWPRSLVRQMLLPTAQPGDTVLDPFGGSGTTGQVALELGLNAILIEPSPMALDALSDRLHPINLALPL
jgi:DNA modification methylase